MHSGDKHHATCQGLARNAACHSIKFATASRQGTFIFQHLAQPVLQDTSKRRCCRFVAVSAAPEVEFSDRQHATCSTAWLFCNLTGQRSMQNPRYSLTMLFCTKSGTCGSSPSSKEDTHPASKPQQDRSGAALEMSAGKTTNGFIGSPKSSPSLANGHRIMQAWLSWSMFGQRPMKVQHHCPASPSSLMPLIQFSYHIFRGRGEDWAITTTITTIITIMQTEWASKLSQCPSQFSLSSVVRRSFLHVLFSDATLTMQTCNNRASTFQAVTAAK